jgi:hypothetical protein
MGHLDRGHPDSDPARIVCQNRVRVEGLLTVQSYGSGEN